MKSSNDAVGSRGAGFGLDAELARKQDAKYDKNAEKLTIAWIENITGESLVGSFADGLKNGQILCNLINKIKGPGTIKKIETSVMPFKQMENISNFLKSCRVLGVADYDVFETLDLFEQKDMGAVIRCLYALSRALRVSVPQFTGPFLDINFFAPTSADIVAAPIESGLNKTSLEMKKVDITTVNSNIAAVKINDEGTNKSQSSLTSTFKSPSKPVTVFKAPVEFKVYKKFLMLWY
jgi:hypothetical protein